MTPSFQRLSLLCASGMLLACTSIGTPLLTASGAEEAYQAGRADHLARRPEEARRHYEAALMAAPGHLDARNALAAWHAEHGDIKQAIALWEGLAGAVAGPASGYVLSNLGYARFLDGDLVNARSALEQACLMDPLNHRAWHHLGNVLGKLGQRDRAEAMYRQAAALLGHDFKSDYALVSKAGIPAIDAAVQLASAESQDSEDGFGRTEITRDDGGVFILRRLEGKGRAVVAAGQPRPMLEIANGNGVRGMARSLTRLMWEEQVVRVSNYKAFDVKHTRVEYRPSFKPAAERLAHRVGASQLVPVASAGPADMRLVIGRDLMLPLESRVLLASASKRGPGG
ncbi:LytR C-terminal domain-containing protein [Massilia sp. PAMC28688]|uniref:LytR C-terminal domain-containing protein n=1 Tax=Massilia sp. PAMC28688 TaxID=2861283 RepID=UPI001C62CE2F|nr:LytR C-terminal domain-containing protein [Massilia sp. PAMC28688]QYF95024.1 LytR C-terminal domain-containing protein [Massilia sp. PAMC28688]